MLHVKHKDFMGTSSGKLRHDNLGSHTTTIAPFATLAARFCTFFLIRAEDFPTGIPNQKKHNPGRILFSNPCLICRFLKFFGDRKKGYDSKSHVFGLILCAYCLYECSISNHSFSHKDVQYSPRFQRMFPLITLQ